MTLNIVGAFPDRATAERVANDLQNIGIDQQSIGMIIGEVHSRDKHTPEEP